MADKRRFDLFAALLTERFGERLRVFDVAGGMGRLNEALTKLGHDVTTFDTRHKHLPVRYARRMFTLDEPCEADLVAGMHPDGATRVILQYAAKHALPFAVVPCCSDNGMAYNLWRKHLLALGAELGHDVEEALLPMEGRAKVVIGRPRVAQAMR